MQEIENWVLALAYFISRRRVDMHPSKALKGLRIISHACDRAMWHVLHVADFGAGYIDKTPGIGIGLAGSRIARIDDGQAIDIEVIPISARVNRPDRCLPHAVVCFF